MMMLVVIICIAVLLLVIFVSLRKKTIPLSSFEGKVVVITGASSGIGSQLAILLSHVHVHLLLNARREEALEDVRMECLKCGSLSVVTHVGDISDENVIISLIDEAIRKHSRLDFVFSNAALIGHDSFFSNVKDPVDTMKRHIDVSFMPSVTLFHRCFPHLESSSGAFVVSSSVAGLIPVFGQTFYSAAKHALFGFFESLSLELQSMGSPVRVVVMPLPLVATKSAVQFSEGSLSEMKGMDVSICASRMAWGALNANTRYDVSYIARIAQILDSLAPRLSHIVLRREMRPLVRREVSKWLNSKE